MILPEMKITPLSYEIMSSSFLPGLHLRGFAYLSEELDLLVGQRHSALGDGLKQQQTGVHQLFEISNA